MKRLAVLVITFLCSLAFADAQQMTDAKGTVYKRISSDRLAVVMVTNLNTRAVVINDDHGNFTIKAQKGDTLLFNKTGFTPQKQFYNGYDLVVYLQPEIQLDQVVIRGQTKKQELNEIMGAYRSQGTFYNGKPPVLSMLTNPITGVYELFGKTPGRARRFAAFAKRETEATEVDRRYNRPFVMRITGITDTLVAQKFMDYYRPSFEDLKTWADYDLIKKVKANYDLFHKNGDNAGMQKLY